MKRWSRIFLIALGLVILALVGVNLYLFQLGGLERLVQSEVSQALGRDTRFSIIVGDISGDLITGMTADYIAIRYTDSTRSFDVVTIESLSAEYSLRSLLNADYAFGSVTIRSPRLLLHRDSTGAMIPDFKSAQSVRPGTEPDTPAVAASESGESLSLVIDDLTVTGGEMTIVDETGESLKITSFDLKSALQVSGGTMSADIERLNYTSSVPTYSITGASGRVTYTEGNLVCQDLTVARGDLRVKLSGNLRLKDLTGTLDVNADDLDLETVSSLTGVNLKGLVDLNARVSLGPEVITGRVNVGGHFVFADLDNLYAELTFRDKMLSLDTLYGTILRGCGIDGSGLVDFNTSPETYTLTADIRNFNLNNLVTETFTSDLSGRLALEGESFSNDHLLLQLDVDLYESSFDEYPLHSAYGRMNITTDSLWFPDAFTIDYFENEFHAVGSVVYSGDMFLEVDADLANLDRYREKLFINQPGGRGRGAATLSGSTGDPDLKGWFRSDSLWVYGLYTDSADAVFDIDRFLSGRQGEVEVRMQSGQAWSVEFDSGYTRLELDSLVVDIDTIGFRGEYADLAARCRLDQNPYPWELAIDTLSLSVLDRDFYNKSRLLILIDSLGFAFEQAAVGRPGKRIAAHNRINFDETMDLNVEAEGIALGDWLKLFQKDLRLEAILSGEADLAGSMLSPRFSLGGRLDSILFRDVYLGRLTAETRYADGLLTADSMVIESESGRYRAEGFIHANLAFQEVPGERFPDEPFDVKITARDTQFDLVYLLLPSVEDLRGDFFADFRFDGTLSEPHLDGQAYIRNGSLKYFDLVDRIRTDSAGVLLRDSMIVIDRIRAYVDNPDANPNAYAEVGGVLTVKAVDTLHYNLDINIPRDIPFRYDLDDIEGMARGNLTVRGDTPPTVRGDLVLSECDYEVEFASDVTGSPIMLALSGEDTWDLNLNIEIPSNYWIRNDDIEAELAGYLNIIRESGRYRFIGELEILRGKGYLFDKTFRFVPDSARIIFEDIEKFNPRLDLWATSRIPLPRSSTEERSYQDLRVHVTGTLEVPEYTFFEEGSDAALSYEAIVPLIVANYYGAETGGSAFEERVSSLISSQVSQIGTRRLGVETFEIDPTYRGNLDLSQTRVTLGKYAGSNLYLWGRTDVGGERPEVGFEYRMSRELMLEGFRDEDEVEGESYHLNLKWHLEW